MSMQVNFYLNDESSLIIHLLCILSKYVSYFVIVDTVMLSVVW